MVNQEEQYSIWLLIMKLLFNWWTQFNILIINLLTTEEYKVLKKCDFTVHTIYFVVKESLILIVNV